MTNWHAFRVLWRRKRLMAYFLMQVINRVAFVAGSTYLYLFLSDPHGAAIAKPMLSVVAMCGSGAMLLTSFLLVPLITLEGIFGWMFLALGLRVMFVVIAITAPPGALGVVAAAIVLEGLGAGIFAPAASSYWSNQLTDAERPRVTSLNSLLILLLTMPVPVVAGALYAGSPRAPLILVAACYCCSLLVLVWIMLRQANRANKLY